MTSFDPLHPLHSAIIEILARRPGMTVVALHWELQECGLDASVPNLYRVIGQMVECQMLVKNKGKIALNLVWVSFIARFFTTVKQLYLSTSGEERELPSRDGERREFHADSLAGLDPIWNHLLTRLTEVSKGGEWLEYASHPYFALSIPEMETRFYHGLKQRGISCRILHGNDTFLDKHGDKLVALNAAETSIHLASPFPKEGYVLIVYADYVVECVLPEELARHFSFFFASVRSMEQFDPQLFAEIFRMKTKCKISVRKSARDAEALRRKFMPFFPRKKTRAA